MQKTILVVDDQVEMVVLLKKRLEMAGYKVFIATNGFEALEIVKKEKMDLILLDLVIPRVDGFHVLEHLKKDKKSMDIPVFLVTGKTDPDSIEEGIRKQAERYITKPFDSEKLIQEVKQSLDLRK